VSLSVRQGKIREEDHTSNCEDPRGLKTPGVFTHGGIMNVPYLDMKTQYEQLRGEIEPKVAEVMASGAFILGEELRLFEEEFAAYCNAKYAVGIASGTDALFLALLALDVGPGDEVITTSNTFIATALAISFTGAKCVFVDTEEDTCNLDPAKIEAAITDKTKVIMPVHLYGQPADMDPILDIAKRHGLKVVEDSCQAHGAEYKGKRCGGIGDIGCFSFYPSKNLGAFGDGGIAVTNDEGLFEKLKLLRDYGRKSKYEHIMKGRNSRLDNLQAAILRIKLRHLDGWNDARIKNAEYYNELFSGVGDAVITPTKKDYARHIYHLYVIRTKKRAELIEAMKSEGIQILVHYPEPIHLQEAYKDLGGKKGDLPVSEKLCDEAMSLPMYPEMSREQVEYVAEKLRTCLGSR